MSIYATPSGITIIGSYNKDWEKILSYEALHFIGSLHRRFNGLLVDLLERRKKTQQSLDRGISLGFLPDSQSLREEKWEVLSPPQVLTDRKVEIITAADNLQLELGFWAGASGIVVDFEDTLSPTWRNVIEGQSSMYLALRQSAEKVGNLEKLPVLHVRPRGIHLLEKHVHVEGEPICASFFDFGLFCFHNARLLAERQGGVFFYVPKIENHYEAEFWSSLFAFTENALSLAPGTIRATILIETLTAAFEMEEILYSLKNHAVGLLMEPRDYIFSVIKKLRNWREAIFPDRSEITLEASFLKTCTELLARTCHKRGASALFALTPYVTSPEEDNAEIFSKLREEKEKMKALGIDAYVIAHPQLLPGVNHGFDEKTKSEALTIEERNAEIPRDNVGDLLNFKIGGEITESGIRNNINLVLRYLSSWFSAKGTIESFKIKEDISSAEIARSQLWQWIHLGALMDSEIPLDKEIFLAWKTEEKELLSHLPYLDKADKILEEVVLTKDFIDFLSLIAYEQLQG
ncbi:malate synthase A [Methylacidiphilum caldifontis]|uniref:malate synthase A n=1 Tax=Methylacidiphilum caldifontis TaxID=2795386 RepID=UPI001A8CD51F|nr:malate synthase A [Methylacidiphilum caldifontis]QSR89109.1 malate synthase A [Methylacidiphilum caldifontis]